MDAAESRAHLLYRVALSVGISAALVCLIIGALLVVNYMQLRRSDPLNNPELVRLRDRFAADPGNADLKEQIRVLQLLSRKAFFTSQEQVRRGGVLLLGFVAVLLVALNVADNVKEKLPDPSKDPPTNSVWFELAARRKAVAWGGFVMVVAGLFAAVLAHSELDGAPLLAKQNGPKPEGVAPTGGGEVTPPAALSRVNEVFLAEWPNFRGPMGDGVAHVKKTPKAWNGKEEKGIVWKSDVPKTGFGSPVVWGDRVYLTGGTEESRTLYCYNTADGSLLWEQDVVDVPGAPDELPEVDESTGWAASSPATDGERVFAIFATGNLVCHDKKGKRLWAKAMGIPENHYAHSSSLLVHDKTLIVQFDDDSDPRVVALDTLTGEERWSAERWAISWASPMCVRVSGRVQVVLVDSTAVAGYDFLDGDLLWQEKCMDGEVAASPTFSGNTVFVANDMAVAAGIALEGAGGKVAASVTWKNEDDSFPDISSPLAAHGYVIMGLSSGYLVALDAATGKLVWEQETDAGFYASPLLVAGDVYAVDQDGVMHVFTPGPKYEEKAAYALGEEVSSTPAVMEGRMYIRGAESLWCVGE
jgi:outer membrane protein assembly factor BamB